jgi:cytochrome c oxidase subunit 2
MMGPGQKPKDMFVRLHCRGCAGVLLCLILAACDPSHSVTLPTTPEGNSILRLFWIFFGVCALVWVLVVLALAVALLRRRGERPNPLARDAHEERRFGTIVLSLAGLTAAIVFGLTVLSFAGQGDIFGRTSNGGIVIALKGHQWWWELTYEDPDPSQSFNTANEIHVPVGVPVTLRLDSADVIHSFWVPSLLGKLDLIPGRHNAIHFTARKIGVYRGQCAEFCGLQHAHMGMLVFVDSQAAYDAWRESQLASATAPETPSQRAGLEVFLASPCVSCHTITGTSAGGAVGPDLTHLASRTTIAAGTLPMTRGALAAWIVNAQGVKPGTQMPDVQLAPTALNPLLDYLEHLK